MSLLEMVSTEVIKDINKVICKFPEDHKRSAIIEGLHILQNHNSGYLTDELQTALADYLKVNKVDVYEVATFYTMYDLKPIGKYKINICTNISCMLNGAYDLLKYIRKKLNINQVQTTDEVQTTDDGKITLKEVECQGACCGSPMLEVNKVFHENLTVTKVDQIIDSLE